MFHEETSAQFLGLTTVHGGKEVIFST